MVSKNMMIAGIVIAIIVVAGISSYYLLTRGPEPVTLRVISGYTTPPELPEALNDIFSDFEEENPQIDIIHDVVAWEKYLESYTTMKAAGTPYDVMWLYTGVSWTMWEPGGGDLHVVTDLVKELGEEDFFEQGALEPGMAEGEYYMVPWGSFSTADVYYRTDLFQEEGLESPKDRIWTWAELLEDAEALTKDLDGDGAIDIYGVGFPLSRSYVTSMFTLQLIHSNGGLLMDADGELVFDTTYLQNTIEAVNFIKDLYPYMPPGVTEWGWKEMEETFYGEKIAIGFEAHVLLLDRMLEYNPDLAPDIDLTVPPIGPRGDSTKPYVRTSVGQVAVAAGTENYEESKDLIKFAAQPEQYIKLVEVTPLYFNSVPIPVRESVAYQTNPTLLKYSDWLESYAAITAMGMLQDREAGVLNPDVLRVVEALYLADLVQDVVIGGEPVEETILAYGQKIRDET